MAEIPMNGQGGSPAQERNLATITNYAGAVLSLALIVGVGVWGYKILARDVSGVPVVRAATGEPMRVAPKDPGGSSAAHQGLSVNKVVSGAGAQKPADRLVLAPKPVVLTDEDTPPSAMQAALEGADAEQEAAAGADAASEELTPQMASIQALAEAIAGDASRLSAAPGAKGGAAEAMTPATAAAPEADVKAPSGQAAEARTNGFGPSLRPRLRPAAFKPQVAAVAETAGAQEEAAVSVPAGTRLVQLGAFDAADVARDAWGQLSGRFEDYMDGKTRVVQRAESGGRVFYRLRAMGFADLSDARRFCAALKAQRADCIPVVAK